MRNSFRWTASCFDVTNCNITLVSISATYLLKLAMQYNFFFWFGGTSHFGILASSLCGLIKPMAHFRRDSATCIFVLMVSSDTCDRKPYALLVQCVPYSGLKETDVCSLVSSLCEKMVTLGMKVSGKWNNAWSTLLSYLYWLYIYRFCHWYIENTCL